MPDSPLEKSIYLWAEKSKAGQGKRTPYARAACVVGGLSESLQPAKSGPHVEERLFFHGFRMTPMSQNGGGTNRGAHLIAPAELADFRGWTMQTCNLFAYSQRLLFKSDVGSSFLAALPQVIPIQ